MFVFVVVVYKVWREAQFPRVFTSRLLNKMFNSDQLTKTRTPNARLLDCPNARIQTYGWKQVIDLCLSFDSSSCCGVFSLIYTYVFHKIEFSSSVSERGYTGQPCQVQCCGKIGQKVDRTVFFFYSDKGRLLAVSYRWMSFLNHSNRILGIK